MGADEDALHEPQTLGGVHEAAGFPDALTAEELEETALLENKFLVNEYTTPVFVAQPV